MSTESSNTQARREKNLQRAVFLAAGLLLFLIIGTASVLFEQKVEIEHSQNQIFGLWEEQNVPSHKVDRFTVRVDGVYVDQRIVDTHYEFDGRTLTYLYQGERYEYHVKDDETTLLERVAPTHYKSIFKVRR